MIDQDPLDQAAAWLDAGEQVALATVVATWGSAPRPVGGQLAMTASGAFAGSVSGGCVEGAVIEAGVRAIADGAPRRLEFGVSDDDAQAVGLACGGRIVVFVEALK